MPRNSRPGARVTSSGPTIAASNRMLQAAFQFLAAAVLPYFAVVFFIAGVLYRLAVWKRVPQPGMMTLYPTGGSGVAPLTKEALFFPSLYRGDRFLWALAWAFHVTLAIALLGHLRIVGAEVDRALSVVGVGPAPVGAMSTVVGGAAGIVLLVALCGLFGRRLLVRRVREISTAPDFMALLLLTAVVTSGNLIRWTGAADELTQARAWFASLFSLAPIVPRGSGVLLHAFCAELLLLYIAFSKLMHFGGFFFTFSLTKRTNP
jgi:nitrate reductase gamma subunit